MLTHSVLPQPPVIHLHVQTGNLTGLQETSRARDKGIHYQESSASSSPLDTCPQGLGTCTSGERWCQSVTLLPGLGRWDWTFPWEIAECIGMRKEKGSSCSACKSSSARAWGRVSHRRRLSKQVSQLSLGGGRDVIPLSPAQFRWALAAAHSLHSFHLSQCESLAGTTGESQCQHQLCLGQCLHAITMAWYL